MTAGATHSMALTGWADTCRTERARVRVGVKLGGGIRVRRITSYDFTLHFLY